MDQIAIISSAKDLAGINIRNNLIKNFDFKKSKEKFDYNEIFELKSNNKTIKSYLINSELVYSEDLDKKIDADLFIFASKHRSKENTPSFAVHSIGNWNEANLGGKPKELVQSSAIFLKNIFQELNKFQKDGYEFTMEATHHGPFLEKPSIFVEIGSTEKEWEDEDNGKIIANTIINSLKNENSDYKIAVGIGGPHYCSNFNKIVLNSNIALSYICPKYNLENLNENIIKQTIEKTKEKADFILLDWKGIGSEKQRILEILKNLNLEYKRTDQI